MIFRWLRLALIAGFCISCSVKETSRNPHQKPTATQTPATLNRAACQEAFSGTLSALCSPESLTAENASAILFSPELMYNPVLLYTESLDSIIWQINQAVLDSKNNVLIERHVKSILVDCHLNRVDSCKRFHRFSKVNNTYDLLFHQLRSNTLSFKTEEFLILTNASLVNRSPLPLIQEIASRTDSLQRDSRLVDLIKNYLVIYNEQIPSLQKKQLLRYIGQLDGTYLNLLSKQELILQINELHQQLPKNIFQKIEEIRPALVRALALKSPAHQDSLFQLLDLVENQQLNLADAQDILLKLTSESTLADRVLSFMRWTFAHQLQGTNAVAKYIAQNMNVGSNDLFDRFQTEADEIRKIWSAYKYQQQYFLTSLIRSNLAQTTKNTLRNLTSSLDQTIKMYSEYPHMFYIATFLAQQDFSRNVTIGVNSIPMSSNSIFNEIVNPLRTKYSWFKYTENFLPLNDLLIRNTISYMIKSSFFASMGINTEVFLGYFIKNLKSHYAQRHHRKIVSMNNFIETNNTYPRLKELCEQNSPKLKVDFENIRMGFILSAFNSKTFTEGISVMMDTYKGGESGYLPFDRETTPDLYEYAKTDLAYYKRILQLIDSNLKAYGQNSPVLTNALQDIENKRNYALTSFTKWNAISACQMKLINEERRIVTFIYEKEKEYFQKVHADIRRLRAARSDSEAKRIVDKYKGIDGFLLEDLVPLQVGGLDIISTEGYLATQFNFYARTAHHLKSYRGAVRPVVMLPPDIKKSFYYAYRADGANAKTVRPQYVPYQDTLSDFTKYFCGAYFSRTSFTQWFGLEAVAGLDPYLRTQIANLAIQNMSINEYFEAYKNITEYYKIKPLEREVLDNLGDRSLLPLSTFDERFLEMNFQAYVYTQKFGLFDFTLSHLMEDVLGYDYYVVQFLAQQDTTITAQEKNYKENRKPLRRGAHEEARIMYDTLRDPVIAGALYGIDPTIVKNEYAALKQKITEKKTFLDNFISSAQHEDLSEVRIDLFVDDSIIGPPFTPYMLNRYRDKISDFHRETNGCFRLDSNCF